MFDIAKEWPERFPQIEKILRESSKISLAGFSKNPGAEPITLSSQQKSGFKDIVTEFDQKVEDFIVTRLKENFPGEAILGEEGAYKLGGRPNDDSFTEEFLWVLDPIDGTANYSRSYPYFCTTLSLMQKVEGRYQIVLAATLDPVRDELFYAGKGMGAFLNDKKIHVSNVDAFEKSLFVTGFASEHQSQKDVIFKRFVDLTRKTLGVRRTGAAALDLAYVACGRLDAYWECGLSAWDVAAGALLVREAGGVISHFERSEEWSQWTGEILASNKNMHEKVLRALVNRE